MAATELLELYAKAQSAAEKANSGEAGEDTRCVEALQAMRALPVTLSVLQSTQVGKQLRKLTKHSHPKIRGIASDIIEEWKKVVTSEATSKNGDVKAKSPRPAAIKAKTEAKNSANSGSSTPSSKPTMQKCNDVHRDKIRDGLLEAFLKVPQEAGPGFKPVSDPVKAAVDVETVLFSKLGGWKSDKRASDKYRSILFNLKDANNPDFRRRVFLGEIPAAQLTTMTSEEMASDQRKAENKQIKDKALFECERGGQEQATTDQFRCSKCGKRECTYYQKQTRSADEPMTTFVTCVSCGKRWKFS